MNTLRLLIIILIIFFSFESLAQSNNLPSVSPLLVRATATPVATSSINFAACYQTTAKKSGSSFDGRIAVGLLCKQKTELLLNDWFISNETTGAKPALERKRIVISGKIPNGVEYGLIATGGNNKFYEVQIAAVCCPILTSK